MFRITLLTFLSILKFSHQLEQVCVVENAQESCKELTDEEMELLKSPIFEDSFQNQIEWQNEPWNEFKRLQQILMRRKIKVNQKVLPKTNAPKYIKQEIPAPVFKSIVDQKLPDELIEEQKCEEFTNCQKSYKIPFLHDFIVKGGSK